MDEGFWELSPQERQKYKDRESAVKRAAGLLHRYYDRDYSEDVVTNARITVAEADRNYAALCSMLDDVIKTCNELKEKMQ